MQFTEQADDVLSEDVFNISCVFGNNSLWSQRFVKKPLEYGITKVTATERSNPKTAANGLQTEMEKRIAEI